MGLFSVYGNVRRVCAREWFYIRSEGRNFVMLVFGSTRWWPASRSRSCNVLKPTNGPIVANTCCESIVPSSRIMNLPRKNLEIR